MISRHLPLFVGVFLSSIFLLLGVGVSFFTVPTILRWFGAASWEAAAGEIVSGEIVSVNSARGGRTVRPHLVWRYRWQGQTRTGEGYGLSEVTTSDLGFAERVLADHPPGASVTVFVNPADPGDSILGREPPSHLVALFVPPCFALLGSIGAFFTFAGWRGWLSKESRSPLGRALRRAGEVFLRPAVLIGFVFGGFGLVIAGLAWLTLSGGNFVWLGLALFLVYGIWQALRFGKNGRKRRHR